MPNAKTAQLFDVPFGTDRVAEGVFQNIGMIRLECLASGLSRRRALQEILGDLAGFFLDANP